MNLTSSLQTAEPVIELSDVTVENARIGLIYQTFVTHAFTAFAVSFLMVYVMWPTNSKLVLLSWMTVVVATSLLRVWHGKLFSRKAANAKHSLRPWAWLAMAHVSFSGITWGTVPLLFLDISNDSLSQIIIAYFFSTFIMVGQSVTYSCYRRMWFAYAIPASSLLIGQLIMDPNPQTDVWAIAIVLTMVFCLVALQKNARSIDEVIRLKLEYGELMNQLQDEKDKADQANYSKTIFLASASHDLRQPVHAMNLYIEMLKKKHMPDTTREMVNRISSCASSLQGLFNSLLDISNLDAGTIDYYPKSVNLRSLVNSMVSLHKPEAEAQQQSLVADAPEIHIDTDPMILTRILSNLISNAIDHAGKCTITVKAEEQSEKITISVIDTGRGIPIDQQKHIFEEFNQLHNPERDRAKGLGLGLAICSRLANILGAKIQLHSPPDQGACFYFDIPKAVTDQALNTSDINEPVSLDLSELSVVIIDDELEIREAMVMFLNDAGCGSVCAAGDIDEAIALLAKSGAPDLIISDYRLRKHRKGIDAIEEIRLQHGQDIKAILVTGDTSPKSLSAFKEAGIVTLHKPVNSSQLLSTINTLFKDSRL